MYRFTLSTDSTCDLYADFLKEHDIKMVPLTFTVEKDGRMENRLDCFQTYSQYVDFYNELRAGAFSRTSMLNYDSHYSHFLTLARAGATDVLHVTISSGLSPTKDVAAQAAESVRKDFPDFRVTVVDPLTATAGQGTLVRFALKCRDAGWNIEDTVEYINSIRLHIQHYIVADDLAYLKKGGRISAAAAAIGGVLGIKPIISFDREGKLFMLDKVRGAKKAVSYIKKKMEENPPDENRYVVVIHTDNQPIADELTQYVKDRFQIEPIEQIMGPVIGSHVGPGAFALGYISKTERNEN